MTFTVVRDAAPTAVELLAAQTAGPAPTVRRTVDYRLTDLVLDPNDPLVRSVDIAPLVTRSPNWYSPREGAPNLEIDIQDEGLAILRGNFLTQWAWGKNADNRLEDHWIKDGRKIDAQLAPDQVFRLVKVRTQGTTVSLTFEQREVAMLREHQGPLKVFRDQMTRAEFVKKLADEAGVPVNAPDLHTTQPTLTPTSKPLSVSQRKARAHKGINRGAGLTVKGQKPSAENISLAQRGLDVGTSLNAPRNALIALIAAYIDENGMTNKAGGGGSSSGSLQLLASTAAANHVSARDVPAVARLFFTKGFTGKGGAIALANKGLAPADIATAVQGNAAGASVYAAFVAEATRWVDAYQPGVSSSGNITTQVVQRYPFSRDKGETSWDTIQRLADEVGWRALVRRGVLWFLPEAELLQQVPAFDMRRPVTGGDNRGNPVEQIDGEVDIFAKDLVAEVTVTAHADMWTVEQGMVATVSDMGPFDGRWICASITRALDADLATILLHKPIPQKPEPAAQVSNLTLSTGNLGANATDPLGKATALYVSCQQISQAGGRYSWGGGHGDLRRTPISAGMDCSGSTSLALFRAGMMQGTVGQTSGWFASSWGQPGRGQFFTVWAHSGHVFIELTLPGRPHMRFDTSQHSGSGPRLVPYGGRSTSGFSPRHWPGE